MSVVIPTFQRRDVVLETVRAAAAMEYPSELELIVVVDGSTDGTANALRALDLSRPLLVLEQENQGAAAARNHGAAAASGELLLFLDDDMEADPRLALEHVASHRAGAEAVVGHLPLHPDSPDSFLSRAVGWWAEDRLERLSRPGANLTLHDLLTGQLSVRAELFRKLGGFDARAFTRHGSFGNEDVDFGYRMLRGGHRVMFNGRAVSRQRYVVSPAAHLRQWRQGGRADVAFARKHPEAAAELFTLQASAMPRPRALLRSLPAVPVLGPLARAAMTGVAVTLAGLAPNHRASAGSFVRARAVSYWTGVREAGGPIVPRALTVLAYHAIADLRGDPLLEPYGVPPLLLRRQLESLLRAGAHFVAPDEVLGALLHGGGLPRRPVLLTFDDGYADLATEVLPLLRELGAPAIAFAVSAHVGGHNEWDLAGGAGKLPLADPVMLRMLHSHGVEIGVHTRTHPMLTQLGHPALRTEIAGAADDLEAMGLPRPRFMAYPYGAHDASARAAARDAGLLAAFALGGGRVRPGSDRFALPRIEIGSRERSAWRFRLTSGTLPGSW